jgi:carboxymethylenebutenolidase
MIARGTNPCRLLLAAALALLPISLACGGSGEAAQDAEAAAREVQTAQTAEPRIPLDPTAEGRLPAAIIGEAPAPMGQNVHYVESDEATAGYLAVPEGGGPFPSVILIHEWNGVVDRIRQTADALAAEGYVALAADLYQGRTGSNPEENMALVRETMADPDAVISNLNAAASFLRARPDVTGKIATMGWCFGGGVALSYAIGGENHDGTAIFYGRLVTDPEVLASVEHEIYGTFAALDQGPPPEHVNEFVEALRAAGIPNDVHIYDDVNHGFWLHVDRSPENRTEPARDAWERLKAYLGRVLSD